VKNSKEIPVPVGTKISHFLKSRSILCYKKVQILLLLATCILKSRTSCLYRAADKIDDCADTFDMKKVDYQHFIKFFSTGKGDQIIDWVFYILVELLLSKNSHFHLILDRTNWEFGKTSKNLLVIGVVYHGCLIPLIWKDLNKKGNSNTQTRLDLLKALVEKWPKTHPIPTLQIVGDREFIGEVWFRELEKMGIKFVFRLKSGLKMSVVKMDKIREKKVKALVLGRYLTQKGKKYAEILIHGEFVCYFVVLPNQSSKPDEPFLYLITNLEQPDEAGQFYTERWAIESCFKHLKSNGFDLESQGFTAPHKIEILTSVLVLMYGIAIFEGVLQKNNAEKKQAIKRYKIIKNGQQTIVQYPHKSIFRTGLTHLEKIFNSLSNITKYIENIINRITMKEIILYMQNVIVITEKC
jgi:hypothetical protein